MRVGILTFSTANNYGAQLQAHALQKQIQELGHVCLHIRTTNRKETKISIKKCLLFFLKMRSYISFSLFRKRYINFDKGIYTLQTAALLDDAYDGFISGSDQVWNVSNGINPFYFQLFVSEKKRKIAYAASIGIRVIPEEKQEQVANAVNDFDFIGVREHSAQKLLKSYVDKEVTYALDPVLLFTARYWDTLLKPPIEKHPYIFVYGTQMTDTLKQCAHRLSEQTGLKVKSIFRFDGIQALDWKTGPLEFVNYVKYADYVITTSFHCTAFAVLYQKNLIEILHSDTGSRAYDLLETLCLTDCIFDEKTDYVKKKWDYSFAEEKLKVIREDSLNFLKSALRE